jgi:hypothetical protein
MTTRNASADTRLTGATISHCHNRQSSRGLNLINLCTPDADSTAEWAKSSASLNVRQAAKTLWGVAMKGAPYFVAIALLTLTACAPTSYQKAVTGFSRVAASTDDSYQQLGQQIVAFRRNFLVEQIAATNAPVITKTDAMDCLNETSAHCRLAATVNGFPFQLTGSSDVDEFLTFSSNMRTYGQALEAIAQAGDQQAVSDALADAEKGVRGIAALLGPDAQAKVDPLAAPVVAATDWVIGEYINTVKWKAIHNATQSMQGTLAQAEPLFRQWDETWRTLTLVQLTQSLRDAQVRYAKAPGDASAVQAYMTAAERLDASLTAKPQSAMSALVTAHKQLTLAVDGVPGSLDEAMKDLSAVWQELAKIQTIVKSFKAAGVG